MNVRIELEQGKYYRTRNGYCVGPLLFGSYENPFPYSSRTGEQWTRYGKFSVTGKPHPRDLVREWKGDISAKEATGLTADSKKAAMLDKAKEAVADRGLNYGKPEDNFLRIARLWNAHLVNAGLLDVSVLADDDKGVTPVDVALMMGLMKAARLSNQPAHEDSWIDIAGYAACGAEIACKD